VGKKGEGDTEFEWTEERGGREKNRDRETNSLLFCAGVSPREDGEGEEVEKEGYV